MLPPLQSFGRFSSTAIPITSCPCVCTIFVTKAQFPLMACLGLANAHLKDGYCFRLCFGLLFICTHHGSCQLSVIDPHSPYFSAKTQTCMSKFLPQNSIVSWEIPVQNIQIGGGIGMGNTCKSMADSCQCMTKPTTIL